MTTTMVKDSIVGDAWLQQAVQQVPLQRRLDAQGQWNGDIITGPVRLAFMDLFELPKPRPGQSGDPKFGATLLFPPNTNFQVFYEEYHKECSKEFPEYWVQQSNAFMGLTSPFRDQAEKMNKYSGYTPGCTFISCSTKFQPSVVDRNCNPIVDRSKVYAGVWAICAVNIYPYGKNPPQPKKGVKFGLQSVMIIADDTKLSGGGVDPRQQFAGINVATPMQRPNLAGVADQMPPGMTAAPAAAIPGYTAPGGGAPQAPPYVPPAVPQTHWTPPGAGATPFAPAPMGYAPSAGFSPPGISPGQPMQHATTVSPSDDDDISFLNA